LVQTLWKSAWSFFTKLKLKLPYYLAGMVEVLNPKGLRVGVNNTKQDTYREGQQADDQLAKFYFSQQTLHKRGRDLNIKNTLI
jgi:hypothetical protein